MIIAQVYIRLAPIGGFWGCLGGGGAKTSQYLVWPPFASRSATHLLRMELIRLLIVACRMFVHSSSMAVRSCWILTGTGTRCRIRRSRASQTCSMGNMSGEYAGHTRTGMFSASRDCVQILATWGRALSCSNMRNGHEWMAQQWASGSRHGISVHSKCTRVYCHTSFGWDVKPRSWRSVVIKNLRMSFEKE